MLRELLSNAGIVTHGSDESAREFGIAYLAAINASDVSTRWDHEQFPEPFSRPLPSTYGQLDSILSMTGHYPALLLNHQAVEVSRARGARHSQPLAFLKTTLGFYAHLDAFRCASLLRLFTLHL